MARNYKPRRAGARWLEGAPEWVLDCFDNPQFADRYTVIFGGSLVEGDGTYAGTWLHYLSSSADPRYCSGTGDFKAHECADYRYRNGKRRVRWLDLPESVRKLAEWFATPEED